MHFDDEVEELYWQTKSVETRRGAEIPEPSQTPGRNAVEQHRNDIHFVASVLASEKPTNS